MNIRIGDIVRFISEKLEGKVTGIINNNTVNVFCDEYGFEIPAVVDDLVVIRSDFSTAQASAGANAGKMQEQKNVTIESADTVYLAIVPENFANLTDTRYEFYVVNDTDQTCLYSAAFRNGEKYTGIAAGNCGPGEYSSLGLYSLREIDATIKAVAIQAIFFCKGNTVHKDAIDAQIKINTVNLCKAGAYKHSRWFNSVTFLRPLEKENFSKEEDSPLDNLLQQAMKEKAEADQPSQPRPQKQIIGNIVEIDLHAEELLETTAGMENKDILEYQMDVFRKTLDEYKLRKGQKIVFIHGKGDGVLRQRILWELQTRYKRFNHQDASFKQYGYGATMVTIK